MRNNTVVNHENEGSMNIILRQLSSIYGQSLNPYLAAKLIGILLVLKKRGVYEELFDESTRLALLNDNKCLSKDLISIYNEVIEEIKETTPLEKFDQIVSVVLISEFSEGEYLRWYDYCLEELETKGHPFAPFSAPDTFATLIDAFLPADTDSVFNPFGGMMHFATDIERYNSMDACDINREAWMIGLLRVELSDKVGKVSYFNRNVDSWTSKHYDAIVAMPPFNAKIQMQQPSPFVSPRNIEEMEGIVISRFAESTNANGCCITFVSPSVLWSSGEKARIREWATKNRYIDTIILLPKNMLNFTNIPVACLILRKNSYHKDGVRMIDASDYFTTHQYKYYLSIGDIMNAYHADIDKVSATIPFEKIEENEYSWNVQDYLNQQEVDCPEGYTLGRIEDVIHFPRVGRSTDNHIDNVVQISDLSDDWTRPYVDIDAIERKSSVRGCAKVTEEAILISTIRTLKPSIIKASVDKPVFVNPNILVAIPNEGLDAEYLCMVLAKTEIPVIGLGVPHISKTRLLRQQIAFPSIEQQRSTYKEARHAALLEQIKSLHLEEVLDRRISEYTNEIRSRKHDMKPHLRQLSSACKNLEYYLTHKEEFSDNDFLKGMKEEVFNQKKAIESLSTLLKIFSREEKFGTPEVINIDEYLLENYLDGDNYEIDHDTDFEALADYGFEIPEELKNPSYSVVDGKIKFKGEGKGFVEGVNVLIAKDDLQRLFDNIINNAIQHGFTDPERHDYNITTCLSIDPKREMFQIDVINNGNPLPEGLNKLRYGLKGEKAGATAGTGEGGYIVRSIVEHYKGDFDLFSIETGNSTLTTIRILLPIYRADE